MAVGFASVTSRSLEELEWGNSDPKGKYSQSVDKSYVESHFNYSISVLEQMKIKGSSLTKDYHSITIGLK